MIFQEIGTNLILDMSFCVRFFAPAFLFYLAYVAGKRIKDAGLVSAITGYVIYMIGMGIFQFGSLLETAYPSLDRPEGNTAKYSVYDYCNYIYIATMIVYTVLTEQNLLASKQFTYKWRVRHVITILSVLFQAIFLPLTLVDIYPRGVLFIGQGILLSIVCLAYLGKYNTLYMARRQRLSLWFFLSLVGSGASNFLQIIPILGEWGFFLNALIVIIGACMQNWAWNRIPTIIELNWLLGLKQLVVIKKEDSTTIFVYDFKKSSKNASDNQYRKDNTESTPLKPSLAGAAFGGVIQLLKDVLSSEKDVNVIDYGDSKIYFSHGEEFSVILITAFSSEEYKYRVNVFAAAFEHKFHKELRHWNGEITAYAAARTIIHDIFG